MALDPAHVKRIWGEIGIYHTGFDVLIQDAALLLLLPYCCHNTVLARERIAFSLQKRG